MTDPESVGPLDESGEPEDMEQVLPPEQVPMDDAAGGPSVDCED